MPGYPVTARLIVFPDPVPYERARALMAEAVAERAAGGEDVLILCEHEPVVTLGKNAPPTGLRVPREELARRGVALHRVERGGEATFHGPGQIVGYPVLKLREHGIGVKEYVRRLEEVMIRAAAGFGVAAGRRAGRPGVFTEAGKLGAVGVAVRAGVTFHGFAFNAAPDLSFFSLIVPCGLADVAPVSIESLTGRAPSLDAVRAGLASAFEQVFDVKLGSGLYF